jgi:hypothetical protein
LDQGASEQIWVYRYRYWDPEKDDVVVSESMATLDAIKSGLGIPVHNTALRVPACDVDEHGRYRVPSKHGTHQDSPVGKV